MSKPIKRVDFEFTLSVNECETFNEIQRKFTSDMIESQRKLALKEDFSEYYKSEKTFDKMQLLFNKINSGAKTIQEEN